MIHNYELLIKGLKLPDPKDCHVLAAAIKANANLIVTNNLKDFPKEYLVSYGLSVKRSYDFLIDMIDLNSELTVESFRKLVLNRKNPKLDEFQVLEAFRRNGLTETANYLRALI